MKHQWPDVDKNYICVKDPFESKYQLLLNGRVKSRNWKFKKSKSIHWLFKSNWWCLWKEEKSLNSISWYDSRYGV